MEKLENITLESGLSIKWSDFTKGTYVEHNGIYITDISKGYIHGATVLKPELLNPLGVLHGGVMVTLADTVGIIGCGYLYEALNISTVNLSASFLKPLRTGAVTAKGSVLSKGKSVSVWGIDEFDDHGECVAKIQVTYNIAG